MNKDMLRYETPAQKWIEALPLGNGRLGAMVYGRALEEMIQVDESTFWSGCASEQNDRADSRELLDRIRKELLEGDYEEADRLGQGFVGNKNQYGTSMPVGNLILSLEEGKGEVSGYERSLSLPEALSCTRFAVNGTTFVREAFASNPAQVLAVKLTGSAPFSLSVCYEGIETKIILTGSDEEESCDKFSGDGSKRIGEKRKLCGVFWAGDARETLHSDGTCGVHMEACLTFEYDGSFRVEGQRVRLTDCREVVCYLDLETDMFLPNPREQAAKRSHAAAEKGWSRLLKEHIADVRPLYERVRLSLGGEEKSELPTDVRIAGMAAGEEDPALCGLMFSYGRYLLIASSREDSPLPTHMGGIWNDNIYSKLDCAQDMHVDMNLQMQYWAAAQCSLPECYAPFFSYLEKILVPSGEKTARAVYGAAGWTAHVVTNPWGFTSLGWGYNWGVFSLGGAWCATLVWDYYTYTRDKKWLEEHGYPLLKGAAAFAADYVFKDEKSGYYMTGPSYSPENMFSAGGKDYFLSLSDTCDVLLVREVLECYKKAAAELYKKDELVGRAEEIILGLPPYQIGKKGQLQEWFEDFEEPIPNHRHTSHLLGLYPFRQIVPERDLELAEAARVTIRRRHENFEITSWGMNMLVGYYARLQDGEAAYEMIRETFQRLVKPNMASVMSDENSMWGGEWELDGNTGLTSAMAELFVQSFEGELILLPALPKAWKDGKIEGLSIRGGHHINLSWKDGAPVRLEILDGISEELTVRWKEKAMAVSLQEGKKAVIEL